MTDRKTGRPTKLTPELIEELSSLLQAGAMIDAACMLVGISRNTFYEWMRRGRAEKTGAYRTLSGRIKKALAFSEISALVKLRQGRPGWQSLAWFLERRHRGRWGRRGGGHGKTE